ncbi:MAG: DUF3054 domain-containing protein [Acidimicrobiia bacterium]
MRKFFWILDATVVMSFVVIGRDSHGLEAGWSVTLRVAAPFLIALAIGIIGTRAWLKPLDAVTGLGLAATTVFLGLLFRRFMFDAGIATIFIVLTAGWMTVWMVGWRLIVNLLVRLFANGKTVSAA